VKTSKILVTCPKGVPPILAKEIASLGFPVRRRITAAVETVGTPADCMRLNLWLRTAHHVLRLISEFEARDARQLYEWLVRLPWEEHIAEDGYVSVTSAVNNPTIRDTRFASLRCKDAVVDRIKQQCGRRPDSGPSRDRSVVFLFWRGRECSVYVDTSGESLAKRGYRKVGLEAPMQETLAAAIVLSTSWRGRGHFVNPMCGSGTLAIEAALLALDRAPGLPRSNFGFMHLRDFDAAAWEALRREAATRAQDRCDGGIIATDIRPDAVEAARRNAAGAGVEGSIEFGVCDFAETGIPAGGGVVVLNPEYGERQGDPAELEAVYRRIGDFLKRKCSGWTGYVFTGNPGLGRMIGLHPRRQTRLFNGGIECRLLEYELYRGRNAHGTGAGPRATGVRSGSAVGPP
jgi:putative N6-adenine-specific DNA methylase